MYQFDHFTFSHVSTGIITLSLVSPGIVTLSLVSIGVIIISPDVWITGAQLREGEAVGSQT